MIKAIVRFYVKFLRFFFICGLWTLGYAYWFQRLMMSIWKFNPFYSEHYKFLYRQWRNGWTLTKPGEWMFVLLMFACIPVWLMGCGIMTYVQWTKWFKMILLFPINLIRKIIKERKKSEQTKIKVTRRKSYKKTRPNAIRAASGKIKPIEHEENKPTEKKEHHEKEAAPSSAPAASRSSAPTQNTVSSSTGNDIGGILSRAGYSLVSGAKIAGKAIDFVGVAADHLLLCLVDSESGDWLADEERFNDEEPLWFSESNHRISPVRVVLNARDALAPMLTGPARGMEIRPMVVIRQGTIINAEDMFEVWQNLKVSVCRFEHGGPNEIKTIDASISSVSAPDGDLVRSVSGIVS